MNHVLLLDCMGTLTQTLSGKPFPQHPEDLQLIEGVVEAIAYFKGQGWIIIGVSNEGGIHHPKVQKSVESAKLEKVYTLQLLPAIHKIYFSDWTGEYCWSVELNISENNFIQIIKTEYQRSDLINLKSPGQSAYESFRKPGSGMLRLALLELNFHPDEVWMIGDRPEDLQAAQAAGVNFCPAEVWRKNYTQIAHKKD